MKTVSAWGNGTVYNVRYNIFDGERDAVGQTEQSRSNGTLVQVYDATKDERTDYIPGPNGALARIKRTAGTDSVTFIHADHLGTARAGTSATGALLFEDFHTPFGESLIHPDATDDQGDYTGHIRDRQTGLSYMQARYQDPLIGRFLSIDPVTFMETGNPNFFNRYAYAFNDPINMLDPDGRETVTSCEGVSATCSQGIGGQTFSGGTATENLDAANMAAAKVNAELTGNSGNEWGTTFEGNADGSVTASISYSNGSGGNVSAAAVEILQGTDNPVGDQHTHPGLPDPSYAYETVGPSGGDINSANKQASASGPFTITVVDGPSGDVVSRAGTPGTYNGDRRTKVPDTGVNRTIGNVGPIPYYKKD